MGRFVKPPREVFDGLRLEYAGSEQTYAEYNYLGSGPLPWVKSLHFETALSLARPHFGADAIDFGCADGIFLPSLSPRFGRVVGIDNNDFAVRTAAAVAERMGLRNVEVRSNEGRDLADVTREVRSLVDAKVLFCLETLEHVGEPGDLWGAKIRLVEHLLDLLADDGVVIISVPTMVGPAFLVQRAVLAAGGLLREPLSTRELLDAGLRGRTDALEPRWEPWKHLGFNHRTLERHLRAHFRVTAHKSLFFSQVYALRRR